MNNLTSNRARGMSGNRHLKKTNKLTKDSISRYLRACEKAKLNYVSCSPYRVPIARLAAAQAYLKKKN